MQELLKQKEA
jgi:hypothetical protein